MNRRNSRQVVQSRSKKSKVIISAIVMIVILILVIFAAFILNKSNEHLNEDKLQKNKIIVEGVGAFSFNPDKVITMRSDLYKENEFSVFDVVTYLDNEKIINVEYYFDESIDSYVVNSINGIQYWAYVVVDKSGEMIETGYLMDKHKVDSSNDYILAKISKDDFQYAYGEINQIKYIEVVNNDLLTISQNAIKKIIEGNADVNLVNELQSAGYNRETIDLIENEIQGYLPEYIDGKYEGTADAHNGKITVEVTIYKGEIIFIEVISHEETAPKLADVFSIIPIDILKKQSTEEVDTVSGATEASEGYIEAVSDALRKAINQSSD